MLKKCTFTKKFTAEKLYSKGKNLRNSYSNRYSFQIARKMNNCSEKGHTINHIYPDCVGVVRDGQDARVVAGILHNGAADREDGPDVIKLASGLDSEKNKWCKEFIREILSHFPPQVNIRPRLITLIYEQLACMRKLASYKKLEKFTEKGSTLSTCI